MGWRTLIGLLVLAGCAAVGGDTILAASLNIPDSRSAILPLTGRLTLPSGQGPFPVVIVLHGCGGVTSNTTDWAARLNGWGYATVVLDSFGPRGVRNVCAPADQPHVTARDRAGDVISMAVRLRSDPRIDGTRIAVLGNSHGGSTAAWVTQSRYQHLYPGLLRASVDYYGACRSPETHGSVPLLALAGEADDWGQPALTCKVFGGKLRADQPFELHTYPGVVHGFDNPRTAFAKVEGHAVSYNHDAAEDSILHVRRFLAQWMQKAT